MRLIPVPRGAAEGDDGDVEGRGVVDHRGRDGRAVLRVWGLGFGVWGLGFRVWGLGFGV